MCITSETCRANSVIRTALNNLHQAGPNKTHIWWCMETQKSNSDMHLLRVEHLKPVYIVCAILLYPIQHLFIWHWPVLH